jgi:fused signal recognition particle receptor
MLCYYLEFVLFASRKGFLASLLVCFVALVLFYNFFYTTPADLLPCKRAYFMFNFLKDKIKKIYTSVTLGMQGLFGRGAFDEAFLQELNSLLLTADTGVATTKAIIDKLKVAMQGVAVTDLEQAKKALEGILLDMLSGLPPVEAMPQVLVLVGINGSGKTTFISKYAALLHQQNKKILLVAGDTFRAAATEQLAAWAAKLGVTIAIGKENQDPSAVIFDACQRFQREGYDHIIIDTAGRLQTKVNLMKELEKIKKTIQRQLGNLPISTWLTIDAMLGQNSLQQATVFHQATQVNGLVLTKCDGTGKGGVVFAITQNLQVPVVYLTFGEAIGDIAQFDPQEYVRNLLNA